MKIQELYTAINAKKRSAGKPYDMNRFIEDISVLQILGVVTMDAAGDVQPRAKTEVRQ